MSAKSQQKVRGEPKYQYTRYIDACKKLDDVNIGNKKFGKAEVECGFLASESKWGTVNSEHVGIIYLDLTFLQPSEYLLEHAEVQMTFKAKDAADTSPTVVKYYAPKELRGPEREQNIELHAELNPSFNLPGGAAFSVGTLGGSNTHMRQYKWLFTGHRLSVDDGPHKQRMRWRWESNPLEPQAQVHRVYLAVAIRHASVPFSIEVAMSGKLRGHFWRGTFGKQEKRGLATVVPRALQEELKFGAAELEVEIGWKNRSLVSGPSRPENAIEEAPAPPIVAQIPDQETRPQDKKSPDSQPNSSSVAKQSETLKVFIEMMLRPIQLVQWLWNIIEALARLLKSTPSSRTSPGTDMSVTKQAVTLTSSPHLAGRGTSCGTLTSAPQQSDPPDPAH
ncbi:uncharacterized protein A1O5_00429 [Cladophialophora psammophila CBS 110553]|uniref:Uncharacterized protein n=1 Tax=Cladophialophora psammophila CBS 110553 TaxID=1182543 RepID=W9XG59_9EURO|nr:uncharacterized protein A1O5_00429 [Cladophialophora psammophila CBS 110553]EXJ75921.1 hypothetical protein A1O5_00429 [Cladophialophora psammophila CBS 110553]